MTAKVLVIHRCKSCPFSSRGIREIDEVSHESYWFCNQEYEIVGGDDIPDWCPLDDKRKTNIDKLRDAIGRIVEEVSNY